MISVRTVFAAFCGALAWFIWTVEHQTPASCYGFSHYLPSATVALVAIVGVVVASRRPWRRSDPPITRDAAATAVLTAIGLGVGVFFAAAVSCSGG